MGNFCQVCFLDLTDCDWIFHAVDTVRNRPMFAISGSTESIRQARSDMEKELSEFCSSEKKVMTVRMTALTERAL